MDYARALRSSTKRIAGYGHEIEYSAARMDVAHKEKNSKNSETKTIRMQRHFGSYQKRLKNTQKSFTQRKSNSFAILHLYIIKKKYF